MFIYVDIKISVLGNFPKKTPEKTMLESISYCPTVSIHKCNQE